MGDSEGYEPGVTTEMVALRAADIEQGGLREQLPGLEPDRTLTDWGRSERLTHLADATLLRFLFHYWHRVEVEGLEHVPADGGALLVANHAGPIPLDGAMISRAIAEEPRLRRIVHLATAQTFSGWPLIGMAATKLGAVGVHPANLHRLLFDEQALVLVFPEGRRSRKPLRWRYRLRRFDQIDFVQAAMRARVPIVPVAVIGSEEAQPTFASLPRLPFAGRVPIGAPVPLPAKLRLRFLEPVDTRSLGDQPWRDRTMAGELTEDIRALIQENVFELVAARRSVWLG